ncbi:tubulin-specific chaperone d-like [Plakobranchus ocellatus]|uniref:Tubulin-specific chaperone D n=1 Tax=Plakobranchus ocellatus TaxID=259542 RepID=A0AAV4BDM2_9GAST|nr:tubulin-specific chaperone d-like [Plakobranchus ocellatus]
MPSNKTSEEDTERTAVVHERFKEIEEVKELITNLENIYHNTIAMEMSAERFRFIIDDYQEQPHLIDVYLEDLLTMLLNIGKNPSAPKPLTQQSFSYLYLITKMRGFKQVVRLLPHEVSDMEPLLSLIETQDPSDHQTWETRYVLLLWLSIVCLIPFDLRRLDSDFQQGEGNVKVRVKDRILAICKTYLSVNDKTRDAAAYLMSRFLTRPDIKEELLPSCLDWMMQRLRVADYTTIIGCNELCGVLATLALLFKHGKREDLLQYAPVVLRVTKGSSCENCNSCVIRKMMAKLLQRLGLTFLKSRVAPWRYQRGSRSLASNLGGAVISATHGGGSNSLSPKEEEEEEVADVPEEIEEVIEHMLVCLKDKETIVRWTGAKGIGRVTGRLPKELADDVVGSVLELFSYQETDGAWHGACLALAELGRRGLLLPDRLQDVVPVIMKALTYDDKRGNFSVGAHVRDAACYVCWAFARAYEPKVMVPYVQEIANCLIIVSVFDREVNVRRAAAAAFQENVGRQGTFPHGIDILTTVDYFAVGSRPHCYLELSVFVANFPEYTTSIINHLADVKLAHWDNVIRELTAKALHRLTACAPDYMASTILPKLLPLTSGLDLFQRHGAILAVAEVVHALFTVAQTRHIAVETLLGEEITSGIQQISDKLTDAKMFKKHGGEYMRTSVCCLIEKCSLSKLPFHNKPVIDSWQGVINECLTRTEPEIQAAAVSAIAPFFPEYYTDAGGSVLTDKQDYILSLYLQELKSSSEPTRQGHSLALGALPKVMVTSQLERILCGLIEVTKVTQKEEKMAEARRDGVKALASLCQTVGVDSHGRPDSVLCPDNVRQVFGALLQAMRDYTLDSRGDIGAWVREAAMQALYDTSTLIVSSGHNILTPDIMKQMACCLVQQAVEKIDRTRALAGAIFSKILYHSPEIPHIPHKTEIKQMFTESGDSNISWANAAQTFPLFCRLLELEDYVYSVLLGLVISVGGLTESIVKHSSGSLRDYLRRIQNNPEQLHKFVSVLLQVFKDFQRDDRVTFPLMRSLDHMLSWGVLDAIASPGSDCLPIQIMETVKTEVHKSGKPQKLQAAADVFCGLLQFEGETRTRCISQLMILLCHKYPRVRKTTAEKIYEALLAYDEVVPDAEMTDVMAVLGDTQWDFEELDELREKRNSLCDMLGVKRPVPLKKSS